MFVASSYQQAIFDYIRYETGHLVVEAVAGSGKSTSLVEAAKLLPPTAKALFAAFNNHIAKELGEKLLAAGSPMECRTVHSLGKSILDRTFKTQKIEGYKYSNLCRDYLQTRNIVDRRIAQQMAKLVDAVRLTLTQPTETNLISIINHYGMDDVEIADYGWLEMVEGIPAILEDGKQMYLKAGIIDFTDMLYLPIALDLPCPKYDVLMLDECQDFNAAQLALIMKCCASSGRMIYVGDRKQAIQGFAFADTNSVNNIIARTGAQVKPLSICYRCASNVVAMAQQIVPTIEASPTAIDGEVEVLNSEKFSTLVQPGDMVLCRTTAPLVEKCLLLLRAGIKAVVRGKDIGKSFIDMLGKLRKRRGFALDTLGDLVDVYRYEQVNILMNVPDSEMKIAALEDKVDTFIALYEAYLNKSGVLGGTIAQFEEYIQSFFSDDEGNGTKPVMFSTVHKSKGLEAQRVFILRPDLFPHPAAKKDWQIAQEYNIEYVALTRAKEHLYFVGGLPSNLHLPQLIEEIEEHLEIEPVPSARRRGRPSGQTSPTKKKDFRFPESLLAALKAVAEETGATDTQVIIELLRADSRIQQKLNVMTESEVKI